MKNVILIAQDRADISKEERKRIIQAILADGKFQIILLIINAGENKDEYLCIPGVKQVMTSLELEYVESMKGLSYEEILNHKKYQTDIETMAYRMLGDYQLSKYYYYNALSFWLRFFDEHKVDIIFHTKAYHGCMHDCCDIVAQNRGIKSFHMTPSGYHHTFVIYTYHHIVPVMKKSVDGVEYLLQSTFDKRMLPPSMEKKNYFRRIVYRIGGNLLEDFVIRLYQWNWKPREFKRKRAKIYWSEKFFGYLKLKYTKRFMDSISCMPDLKKKYICYFLHFEPEASIQSSTILANQLVILKMLSETLPKEWVVYVKEHPTQYNVNNDVGYSFLFDAPLFKTKKFYEKINSIPNVKLVKQNISSEKMIENSQAVSSILGTVFYESVLKNKPVLMFSDINPVAYLKDSFSIHSYDECEKAMRTIERGFYPDYGDADEVISKYIFKGEHMAENMVGLLNCEFN